MSVELVTGHSGSAHVSSADAGEINATTFGDGVYCTQAPSITVANANTIVLGPGCFLFNGRFVLLHSNTSVTLESGSQGAKRIDLICLRYELASGGTESVSLVVKQGTPSTGTPTDPTPDYEGSIRDGSTTVDAPIIRVTFDALNPTAEVATDLCPMLHTNTSIWDSVSQVSVKRINFTAATGDGLVIGGVMVNGIAAIGLRWWGNGEFTATAWQKTKLATMSNCRVDTTMVEMMSPCIWSDSNNTGTRFFWAIGQEINFRVSKTQVIGKNSWHTGVLIFPCSEV